MDINMVIIVTAILAAIDPRIGAVFLVAIILASAGKTNDKF